MILITGATGKTGGEIIRQLSSVGVRSRALVRDPEKAKGIQNEFVEVVKGDFESIGTLDAALHGIEKVYLVSPSMPRKVELESNVIEAAKRAGVKHLVKLSVLGVGAGHKFTIVRDHEEIEERVRISGIPFTILRPGFFMQNLFAFAKTVSEQDAFYAPNDKARMSMIDMRDIAAVAVNVLTKWGHEGKIYELTGPEPLPYTVIAERLSRATGRTIKFVPVKPKEARRGLLDMGVPPWLADVYMELYEASNKGYGQTVTDTIKAITGRDPRNFDQFAVEFKNVFAKKYVVEDKRAAA